MDLLHKAFMAKNLVRVTNSESSLWARMVRVKYRVGSTKTSVSCPAGASWAWRVIAKANAVAKRARNGL